MPLNKLLSASRRKETATLPTIHYRATGHITPSTETRSHTTQAADTPLLSTVFLSARCWSQFFPPTGASYKHSLILRIPGTEWSRNSCPPGNQETPILSGKGKQGQAQAGTAWFYTMDWREIPSTQFRPVGRRVSNFSITEYLTLTLRPGIRHTLSL